EKQSKWLAQAWWITRNERRNMMDYDALPDENRDKVLVPGGVQPLEVIADRIDIDNEPALQAFERRQRDSGDTGDNSPVRNRGNRGRATHVLGKGRGLRLFSYGTSNGRRSLFLCRIIPEIEMKETNTKRPKLSRYYVSCT